MALSKKHYQAIAREIYVTRAKVQHDDGEYYTLHVISGLTVRLADMFKADNPAFDRERFTEACETGTTRGMRK
jgi:hypothetical protein